MQLIALGYALCESLVVHPNERLPRVLKRRKHAQRLEAAVEVEDCAAAEVARGDRLMQHVLVLRQIRPLIFDFFEDLLLLCTVGSLQQATVLSGAPLILLSKSHLRHIDTQFPQLGQVLFLLDIEHFKTVERALRLHRALSDKVLPFQLF